MIHNTEPLRLWLIGALDSGGLDAQLGPGTYAIANAVNDEIKARTGTAPSPAQLAAEIDRRRNAGGSVPGWVWLAVAVVVLVLVVKRS